MTIYTVQPGDTVFSIAESYGTTPERIITDNRLGDPGSLVVGQTLVLLYPDVTYTVQAGDTLESVAREYGTTVQALLRNNTQLGGEAAIFPGQTLTISYDDAPTRSLRTNGYAYPYISQEVLRAQLPFLTYLSIFSYGINEDGTLIEPVGGDETLIDAAIEYDTVPLMMLTSLTSDGTFSNELVNRVLSDEALRTEVINNTLEVARSKGYGGVDVDFEYISPEYADEYAAFVAEIRSRLAPEGMEVFVALAPKSSAEQRGLLYQGHDYRLLGEAADNAFLMTYEWGYQFGPPLAVTPLNRLREVADYAVTEIPPEKLFLGVPSYGYDWRIPYVSGTAAQPVSSVGAVELAREKRAAISFDETAQAPYFNYFDRENGRPQEHIVWFQDARSINAILNVAEELGMRGIGVWNIMRLFPQLWLVVNSRFSIEKM